MYNLPGMALADISSLAKWDLDLPRMSTNVQRRQDPRRGGESTGECAVYTRISILIPMHGEKVKVIKRGRRKHKKVKNRTRRPTKQQSHRATACRERNAVRFLSPYMLSRINEAARATTAEPAQAPVVGVSHRVSRYGSDLPLDGGLHSVSHLS